MNKDRSTKGAKVDKLAYSVDEAAEALGVGRTLVYDLIRDGQLVTFKLGQRRLVSRGDLEAMIDSLRQGAA